MSSDEASSVSDEEILNEIFSGVKSDDENDEEVEDSEAGKFVRLPVLDVNTKPSEREKQLMKFVFGDKETLIKNLSEKKTTIKEESDDEDDDEKGSDSDDDEPSKKKKRKAAWVDEDDTIYKDIIEKKLKRVVGKPTWADLDRQVEYDSDEEILQTVGHLAKLKSAQLRKTVLGFKKLRNLNRTTQIEGPIVTSVEFHPTSTVALVSGRPGIASLFSVDGYKNEKLHTMKLKKFLIQSCHFNRDGNEIIFGGNRKYIHCYDLLKGVTTNIRLPTEMTEMSNFEISPNGEYFVAAGKFGEIFVLDSKTKELQYTLRQENKSTAITFSTDSSKIFSHSNNSEVSIFDVRSQSMMHKFYDDGCLRGSTITVSPNGSLLASGSEEGVVNVYNYDEVFTTKLPKPIKTIMNITTAITALKFNPTSEILAMSSNLVDESLKMVHFPSATVFNNVPEQKSSLGKPNVLAFSPGGKYFAVGDMYKSVVLYGLGHYPNY